MKVLELGRLSRIGSALWLAAALAGCPNNPVGDDAFVASGIDAFSSEIDAPGSSPDAPAENDARSDHDAFVPPDVHVEADAPFDAGPPDAAGPPCPTEGMMRSQPCSCLATRVETCVGGTWRVTEPCESPGGGYQCEPGSVRPYDDPQCGVATQECTRGCVWGEPEYTVPPGVCVAGSDCFPISPGCICRADCTCPVRRGDECI